MTDKQPRDGLSQRATAFHNTCSIFEESELNTDSSASDAAVQRSRYSLMRPATQILRLWHRGLKLLPPVDKYCTSSTSGKQQALQDSTNVHYGCGLDIEQGLRGDVTIAPMTEDEEGYISVCWNGLTVQVDETKKYYMKTFPDAFLDFFGFINSILNLIGARKRKKTTILDSFQGICRPGEMVLVLGNPGSGCTTFLKAIANQRHRGISIEGEVFYGPLAAREFSQRRGQTVYNAEVDVHCSTLTVEQTLGFAIEVTMPTRRPHTIKAEPYRDLLLSSLLGALGMGHTKKTLVGDEFVRGISGGERKRVSIAEMLATNASVFCWDKVTRGLDASTALDCINALRAHTNLHKAATFVSLNQASENIYKLFDKVLVINKGQQVFFGPVSDARPYFEGLGFESRPRQSTPDYLISCTDSLGHRPLAHDADEHVTCHPESLSRTFQGSVYAEAAQNEIRDYKIGIQQRKHRHYTRNTDALALNASVYQIGFHKQIWALVKRQYILKLQDRFNLILAWVRSIVTAIVLGTIYFSHNRSSNSVFSTGGLLFMAVMFNAFQSFCELGGTMLGRSIVHKHKTFAFYRPSALWIAQIIVDQAFTASEIMLFSIIVYFMTGLVRDIGAFFTFYLMVLSSNVAMTLFFRTIGCLSSDFHSAIKFCIMIILLFFTTCGYLIQYQFEKPWLRWLYWINPLGLIFGSLMQNEFQRVNITCPANSLIPFGPEYHDMNHRVCILPGSSPGTPTIAGSRYIAEGFSYYPGDLWRNWGIILGLLITFLILNVAIGEFVSFDNVGNTRNSVQRPNEERNRLNSMLRAKREARSTQEPSGSQENPKLKVSSDGTLTWESLCYEVPSPEGSNGSKKLLGQIYGYVQPGQLVALMGASGAGKTTLLNVLASRTTTGVITGNIAIDGTRPGKHFWRSTAYAEQLDLHEPTQTVREALRFSAELRQPSKTPILDRHSYVEEIIALLELDDIADCMIGTTDEGLTAEQRKRVTIGVELTAKPELLLFLDEPTSGLDSRSASNIVRFLRKLAAAGQAILCTIHQPDSKLFESFDRLLLLQRGGRVVYFGDIGKDAVTVRDYFSRNGATPGPEDNNVAEYMLKAIGAGCAPRIGNRDWADIWDDSPEFTYVKSFIDELGKSRGLASKREASSLQREYAAPFYSQLIIVSRRMLLAYWRSPNYIFTRLVNHFTVAFISGLTYLHLGNSLSSLQQTVFVVFQVTILPALIISQVEVMFHDKRAIFYHESLSKMYSPAAFTTAMILAEVPCSVACTIVFYVCIYFMPGLGSRPYEAGYQFCMVLVTEFFSVTLGQGLAALTPSSRISNQFDPFIFVVFGLFCGVNLPVSQMPTFWRSWLYHLNPFTRLVNGMAWTALHNFKVACTSGEVSLFRAPENFTCGEYMAPFFRRNSPGYLLDNDTSICEYCPYTTGEEFYSQALGLPQGYPWRDLGIYVSFIASNLTIIFLACRFLTFRNL